MSVITVQLADTIRRKLDAKDITKKNSVHDIYGVYFDGKLVANFGISRGSKKDKGHGHIPKELNVRPRFAYEMAVCMWGRDDYLREVGVLPPISEAKLIEETAPLFLELPSSEPPTRE